ncbi:hypothetical protein KY289_033446 [Solanum tuberosum]|nr:hypothetical protein KY289_033446 [Solanum tuberosum]
MDCCLYKISNEIPQNPDEKIEVGGCCRESCGSCCLLTFLGFAVHSRVGEEERGRRGCFVWADVRRSGNLVLFVKEKWIWVGLRGLLGWIGWNGKELEKRWAGGNWFGLLEGV